ncbi:MAG: phospho-N-acetylmuramoyl-pentapeptide-transferase [Rhizomicrobium sp.]
MFQFLSLLPHADQIAFLRLFKYLTFRSGGAVLTALFVAFVMGPGLIRWLKQRQGKGQPIRTDGPQRHILEKQGTPTMGGLLILLPTVVSTLFWADLANAYVWIVLLVTVGYGLLGFIDDYLKVSKRTTGGVSGRIRLVVEFGIAFVATWLMMRAEAPDLSGTLAVPFLKSALIPFGIFFILVGGVVIAGAANAVNFTDGLDGLAIVPVMIAAATFLLIAYLVGNVKFADYLQLHYVAGTGELTVFLASLVGAGLGFLWYNAPPAMVFMGDNRIAAAWRCAWRRRGRCEARDRARHRRRPLRARNRVGDRAGRVVPADGQARVPHGANPPPFRAARLKEPTIVIRFWIVAVVLALIGLSTLKLR